ncbi:MAG: alpha/beta hydrolase [Clostridia bacterium]|nr:alpha/beta hydrolase [Clostridia bacterium]
MSKSRIDAKRVSLTEENQENKEAEKWNMPVILIHGITDNTAECFGAVTSITSKMNFNYDSYFTKPLRKPPVLMESEYGNRYNMVNQGLEEEKKETLLDYREVESQKIVSLSGVKEKGKPYNLASVLCYEYGYRPNINLFAFNYGSIGRIKFYGEVLAKYIENLIAYANARSEGDIYKAFFSNGFQFNLVGHSMGGLVSRYFIENMGQSARIKKLVTIDTPHWGSGLAEVAEWIRNYPCDLGLQPDSTAYGGKDRCGTPPLNYQNHGSTQYYAIAGVNLYEASSNKEDEIVEIETSLETYAGFDNLVNSWEVVKNYVKNHIMNRPPHGMSPNYDVYQNQNPNIFKLRADDLADDVVNLLSQVGWSFLEQRKSPVPLKKIQMERIIVNIDSNGGNWLASHFHGKNQHRKEVIEKLAEFLGAERVLND